MDFTLNNKKYKNPIATLKTMVLSAILAWTCMPVCSHAIPIDQLSPPTSKPVIDEANLLSTTDEQALIKQITDIHNTTGDYIVVVTVPSVSDTGLTPKDYAVKLFEKWQIGNKDKDNGLLILNVADVRRLEIETGYGLEGALPDAVLKRIQMDKMVPAFKQKNFAKGFHDGIADINDKLVIEAKNHPQSAQNKTSWRYPKHRQSFWEAYIIISLLLTCVYLTNFFYKRALNRYRHEKPYVIDDKTQDIIKKMPSNTRMIIPKSNLWWEATVFNFLSVFGTIGVFIFLVQDSMDLWLFIELLIVTFLIIRLVSVGLTYRQPTTSDSYWELKKTDMLYLRELTNPKFRWYGLIPRGIFSPWFAIGMYLYQKKFQNTRHKGRICPCCQHTMTLVPSEKSFKAISHFYQQEISHGFAEYDIWLCQNCKFYRTLRYPGRVKTPYYMTCPQCRNNTYCLERQQILRRATYESTGLEVNHFVCLACDYQHKIEITTPMRVHSSSDSDSGSSSSSWSSSSSDSGYSSSDGGSSGGGGSGSDY